MSTSLPFRSRVRNVRPATTAPAGLVLLATRAAGPDACIVVLRADIADLPFAAARRHAVQVLGAMLSRFPDLALDVQLLDASGTPVCIIAGGAR